MHARFCDPRLGRFLSLDPVRGSPGKPQSWNRYAYVAGNPIRYWDPKGREARLAIDTENRRILVSAQIDIWGEGASVEVASEIKAAIEGIWSGSSFTDPDTGTKYEVVVEVSVRAVASRKAATAPNRIQIVGSRGNRDSVNTFGRVDTGRWSNVAEADVRAHEFGHLLGLPDDYDEFPKYQPHTGHDGHLMAGSLSGKRPWLLDDHEIQDAFQPAFKKLIRKPNLEQARVH